MTESPDAVPDPTPIDASPPPEEPETTGTLFIMILFLMAMGAMWALMYLTLLGR